MIAQYKTASGQPMGVLDSAKGDVTGDGVTDQVMLTGTVQPDSPLAENLVLVVRDGQTGQLARTPLPFSVGYNPGLFLGDFTGDGVLDILIRIDTGGSGAITNDLIYSFLNSRPKMLFNSEEYNKHYTYSVNFRDHHTVAVKSFVNRTRYLLDISYKGRAYLSQIYNPNGTLKKPIEGFVNPLSSLFPVDLERDGIYELLAFQAVSGQYAADGLGYVQNILKWKQNRFALFQQTVGIFGEKISVS